MGLQIFGLKCPKCKVTNSTTDEGKHVCNNCGHIFEDTHPLNTEKVIKLREISSIMEDKFPFNKVFSLRSQHGQN